MKKHITFIVCLVLTGLLAGCDQERPAPVKEGVIAKVVWTEAPNEKTGLFRMKTWPTNTAPFGEYGVEMTGKLYPNFLEVQRVGDSHTQIIPMSQILELEFGE